VIIHCTRANEVTVARQQLTRLSATKMVAKLDTVCLANRTGGFKRANQKQTSTSDDLPRRSALFLLSSTQLSTEYDHFYLATDWKLANGDWTWKTSKT
jgi:hypothetical protein